MQTVLLVVCWFGVSCMLGAQTRKNVALGLNLNSAHIQSTAFSPYVKSGIAPGISIRYEKVSKRPWYIQLEFAKGDLSSSIDEGRSFYELFHFALRYTKLFSVSEDKMWLGGSVSLLNGIVGQTPFPNNSFLYDVSVPALALATLNRFALNENILLENHLLVDLMVLLARNDFTGTPVATLRLSTPFDRINLANSLRLKFKNGKNTVAIGYRFSMIRNTAITALFTQHGLELIYSFNLDKAL